MLTDLVDVNTCAVDQGLKASSSQRVLSESTVLNTGAVRFQRGGSSWTHLDAGARLLGRRWQRRRGVEEQESPAVHGHEEGPEVSAGRQENDDAAAKVEVVQRLEQSLQRGVQVRGLCHDRR